MAHVALVDADGIVLEVHVINNSDLPNDGVFTPAVELAAQQYQADLGLTPEGCRWLLTSYNSNFRGRYAAVGSRYNDALDEFIMVEDGV